MLLALRRYEKHLRVKFLLVGPDDRESLDRLNPRELEGLSQAAIWLGQQSDISVVLALSDIFVLPSAYREGIPRVLFEAAAMGLPIITTDSPSCNEVVENGQNGLLISVRDVGALTDSLLRLFETQDLCQSLGRPLAKKRLNVSISM